MKLLTNKQMKDIEYDAINHKGIPSIILMEHAAMAVTAQCLKQTPQNVLVYCGKGNNGGDGLAVARQLMSHKINVAVVFVGDPDNATKDCRLNLEILTDYKINIIYVREEADLDKLDKITAAADVVVDALIGTGLHTRLNTLYCRLVDIINENALYTISVDCPTGINSDTGENYDKAIYADTTVTFHLPKVGLMLYPAYSHIGRLITGSISLPIGSESTGFQAITEDEAKSMLPKRKPRTNKGSYGKALLIAGCDLMAGAAVISAKAAYRTGCGLVNACVNPYVATTIHNAIPEAITTILPDKDGSLYSGSYKALENILDSANAVAIGPGLGIGKDICELVEGVIENTQAPIIIDGDGLNAVAENTDILKKLKAPCIITPHLKEMSRLTGLDTEIIAEEIVAVAGRFAREYNVITVLKDAHTVIALPKGDIYINTTGTPAMSKAGSGDCLTGIILSLLAQGFSPEKAAVLGAYINGKAGEEACKQLSEYSVLASDTINNISTVMNNLLEK